ncbi:carbohydrate ABC transporter permease [Paenibacillus glycanilyticus]|uniref:carbohydrate ABC transporter permease n=1 Tax=Paenibacillus glycanilyticus TaxID=126569 RepID=UPI00203BBFCA|nr:carbohydrate ABC transporter permease [Paenibacillus glycanilyticus]MCM3626930.1 carbohydrate ABC transporter permease [Paenibacillus glycanilyticus]
MKALTFNDRLFTVFIYILMAFITLSILYPLYFIVIASFTDPNIVNKGGILLYPSKFYFDGYNKIFDYKPLWTGYANSILYTICGTLVNLAVTIPAAYALSRRDLAGRTPIMMLFVFTMFFSGGLIPSYLLISKLGLLDSIWALILPTAASVWNIIITRTFFQSSIPDEMHEAAVVDGCTDFRFFFSMVLPLSKVIIAVMALFYGIAHWNSFFEPLIYLTSDNKFPLQVILRNLLISNEVSNQMVLDPMSMADRQRIAEQLKYGVIVASCLPLLIAYPFIQKYFTQGVMIGSIKG